MHELSVCLSLLEQVGSIAAQQNSTRVTRIELRVGPLSGIEAELLRNAWPLASAGTIAADAELVIDEADVIVHCSVCDADSAASANRLVCGQCGDYRTNLVSGDDMILQRIELESA